MRAGISTATFFSKEVTEDSFSVIKRCGGDLAEVFLTTYCEYEEDFVRMLLTRLDGVEVYSVHSLNTQFEPQLFNVAARTRQDAEIVFKKVLRAGQLLGAKVYTFHGIPRLKKNAVIDPQSTGKRLEELGQIALGYGVRLCLENVHWAMFNSPDFWREASKFCPSVGTVLDIKQAWQSGFDWREYVAAMGASLKNVHVSDITADGRITMVGKGVFPFDSLVAELKAIGYDGPLLIEQYAKNYTNYDEVALSLQYLKNIIGG